MNMFNVHDTLEKLVFMWPSTTCNEYANKNDYRKRNTDTFYLGRLFICYYLLGCPHLTMKQSYALDEKKYNRKKMGRWINGQLCSMRCLKHSAYHTRIINLQNTKTGEYEVELRLPDGALLITMTLPFRIPHKPKSSSREIADSRRQQHLWNFALYNIFWLVFGHSLIKQEMRWWVPEWRF